MAIENIKSYINTRVLTKNGGSNCIAFYWDFKHFYNHWVPNSKNNYKTFYESNQFKCDFLEEYKNVKDIFVIGGSKIYENVFGSYRFQAAPELARMGASISVKNNRAVIFGKEKLYGAECICSDLRSSFSIILGAIAASGVSKINRVYHGLRGYYKLDKKLKKIGVKIKSLT